MSKQDIYAVIRTFAEGYLRKSKKEKTQLLAELVQVTGYHKKYLTSLLNAPPKRKRVIKRKRWSNYNQIIKPLKKLWAVSNYACGQRLQPIIPSYLAALRRHKELLVTKEERILLLQISSATIDRLLKADRRKINIKGDPGLNLGYY